MKLPDTIEPQYLQRRSESSPSESLFFHETHKSLEGKEYQVILSLRFVLSKYVDKLDRGKEIGGQLLDSIRNARPTSPVNADHQIAFGTVTSGTAAGLGWSNTSARHLRCVSCFHAVGVLFSAFLITVETAVFVFESQHCTHRAAVLNMVSTLSILRCKTERHFNFCVL